MTAQLVVLALIIGVLSSEGLTHSFAAGAWFSRRLHVALASLRELRSASTDDEKERCLVRAGLATLGLSLRMLAALALLAMLFFLPPFVLAWDDRQAALYIAIASVAAVLWWILRGRRRSR